MEIYHKPPSAQKRENVVRILVEIADGPRLTFKGRHAWALYELISAGPKGVAPVEAPAPRWSQYVHMLRRRGVPVVTNEETHGGPYKGRHGRYVLTRPVSLIEVERR